MPFIAPPTSVTLTDLTPDQLTTVQAHCAWRKENPEANTRTALPEELVALLQRDIRPLGVHLNIYVPTGWLKDDESLRDTTSILVVYFQDESHG